MVQCRIYSYITELPCSECALEVTRYCGIFHVSWLVHPSQGGWLPAPVQYVHLALTIAVSRLRPLQIHPEVLNNAQTDATDEAGLLRGGEADVGDNRISEGSDNRG